MFVYADTIYGHIPDITYSRSIQLNYFKFYLVFTSLRIDIVVILKDEVSLIGCATIFV